MEGVVLVKILIIILPSLLLLLLTKPPPRPDLPILLPVISSYVEPAQLDTIYKPTPPPLPKLNVNINIKPEILKYLESVSGEYELSLLQGLIQLECEGTWNPNFIDNEDYGLCQINKCNHGMLRKVLTKKYGYFDILDYRQNIDSMIFMLNVFNQSLSTRLGREPTISEILTAYNKGSYYVQKNGIYKPYVNSVLNHQKEYQIWNDWRNKYEQKQ